MTLPSPMYSLMWSLPLVITRSSGTRAARVVFFPAWAMSQVVRGRLTPAFCQARMTSPEQSNDRGPAPPH